MDWLALAFMQRALVAALLAGVTSPAIGAYIVQRRLSLLGDGLGHVAIAGVGLALATGTAPLPMAVVVSIAGAVVIELLRQSGRASADVAMAVLFYGGLATGVLLAGLVGQGTGMLSNYLFGSLLTISASDLYLIGILAVVILGAAIGLMPQLFTVCTDEDFAHTTGLRVRLYNQLIVVLAAITVTVSMRTVGLLMVSALMVVPVATANNLLTGFRRAFVLALGLGITAAVAGVIGSYYLNAPPGSMIVVITIAGFVLSLPLAALLRRHRRPVPVIEVTDPAPLPHEETQPHTDHVHGPGCGHLAIVHGDHVDYIHDGHRHAAHGAHYDEH